MAMVSVYEIKKINAKNAKTEAMTSSNFYYVPISQTKLENISLLHIIRRKITIGIRKTIY